MHTVCAVLWAVRAGTHEDIIHTYLVAVPYAIFHLSELFRHLILSEFSRHLKISHDFAHISREICFSWGVKVIFS